MEVFQDAQGNWRKAKTDATGRRGQFAKKYSRQFAEIETGAVSSGRVEGITEWEYVSSSRIAAVRYDYEEMKLCVKFIKLGMNLGLAYVYEQIPPPIYMQFVQSDSLGKYVNSVLNNFPYHPATDDELDMYFDGNRY
jgi:hypothetical protein